MHTPSVKNLLIEVAILKLDGHFRLTSHSTWLKFSSGFHVSKIDRNEKDGGCTFTIIHRGRKSVQKANLSPLNDRHKRGSYFLCFVTVLCP